MDFPKVTELKELVAALAPGLIILSIRQWFIAAPRPDLKDRLVAYAAVSAAYYALANPVSQSLRHLGFNPWGLDALEYAVAPVLIGGFLAVAMQKDWSSWFWRLVQVHPIHHVPTAWDYSLSRVKPDTFVLITLKDGSQVAGLFDERSFASSDTTERDILIGEVWSINYDGPWTQERPSKSILICGGDVRFIEMINGAVQ